MKGLYTGPREDSFKDDETIKREMALNHELPAPQFLTDRQNIHQNFHYWAERTKVVNKAYMETEESNNYCEIRLPETSLITFSADHHIGSPYTDVARIQEEAETIANTPNSYVIEVGDLINSFFFNPAQYSDPTQTPEQIEFARSMLQYFADKKKLLGVWTGNHDQWVKKAGFNPYRYLLEGIDTYYFHGVGYMKIFIGEQEYRITANHMWKGSSMYNPSHPERRALNESARNSDIIVGGHWHTKGIQQIPVQSFGGGSTIVTLVALGSYKATDEYIKTYGFSNRDPNSMYGVTVRLDKNSHSILPYYDTIQAHKEFK